MYCSVARRVSSSRSHLLALINEQLTNADLQGHLLSENGLTSLSSLTSSLLNHIQTCHQDERQEAFRCLNKLGVAFVTKVVKETTTHKCGTYVDSNLSLLSLQYGDESDQRDFIIISHILYYLLYDSQNTMCICDSVLAEIFGSKAGNSIIQSLRRIGDGTEHMLSLLSPYTKFKSTAPAAKSTDNCMSQRLWNSYRTLTYEHWVRELTCSISKSCTSQLLRLITPLCTAQAEFCELVLPYLIHDILGKGDRSLQATISSHITHIANKILSRQGMLEDTKQGQRVGSTILNIVQYLRTKANKLYYKGSVKIFTAWHDNFWLDVDYVLLAKLALFVKNYALAALYAELRINNRHQSQEEFKPQQLMIQIYSELDSTDILYGWGVNKLTDDRSRLTNYSHEMKWSRALAVKDSMLAHGVGDALSHSLESLKSSGLTQLLDTFLQNMDTEAKETQEMRYQQALANMTWNSLPTATRLGDEVGFNECLYMTSKAVMKESLSETETLLNHLTEMCEKSLVEVSLSTSCRIATSLANLEHVQILKDIMSTRRSSDGSCIDSLVTRWTAESARHMSLVGYLSEPELKHQESRLILSSPLQKDKQSDALDRFLVESTISLSSQARQSNLTSLSEHMLDKFKKLHPLLWNTECDVEQAMTYWHLEESDRAMHLIRKCISSLETETSKVAQESALKKIYSLHSKALRTYGCWLGSTKLQTPEAITQEYLLPAVKAAEKSTSPNEMEEAYHTVAEFADQEYERLKAYMKSSEFQDKLNLHKIQLETQADLSKLSETQRNDARKYKDTLEHNLEVNEMEIEGVRKAFVDNMLRAITNHIKTMSNGDKHDLLSVFRLVALWFDNEEREDIRSIVREHIPGSVSSHKFLPLMCQLTARLSTESCDLQIALVKLIVKAANEHPHHVIPMLFSLKSAATDLARGSPPQETKSRATAAKNVLMRVGGDNSQHNSQLVKDYNVLTTALIQLANVKGGDVKLTPANFKIAALSSLRNAHVLTHHLKPRPSCDYSDVPHVYKYGKECQNAGGVNMPKIIYCIGSDGKKYKQLCKGRDDARQDAVMQQVFSLVNELLRAEQSTRSISIRTYQVIPLSQRSGLLEWCEGTIPVGVWLGAMSSNGAHKRYHPEKWSVAKCREKMKSFKRSWSDEQYCTAYNEICSNLPPVLRHFFLERFKEAELWLRARHNYSQSVAATSMVGYILGIGDRHTNNMLLDEKSGELIHIDFGIAFDKGKTLPTPETIPFRLSRDIVDGFGPTGVNGAFKRCCEKTMGVLRNSDRVINTILQVLIDDPLLDWTLTAEKLELKQKNQARPSDSILNMASQSVSGTQAMAGDSSVAGRSGQDTSKHQQAANALLRVRHKLQGYEQNSQLSISGQVNYLIQQATDPCNLSKLFPGWQPFL